MLELGVNLLHLPGRTPFDKADGAARLGFRYVEVPALDWEEDHVLNVDVPGRAEEFAQAVGRHGLRVSALQCHVGAIASDPAQDERNLRFALRTIDLAPGLEAPVVHLISDRMERRNLAPGDWERLVRRLEELLQAARRRSVLLALEPCVNSLVWDTRSALRLFSEVPELRANFDPSHLACIGEDPVPLAEALRGRIAHCHAKDGLPDGQGIKFTPVGRGTVDWGRLLGHLQASGYEGVMSIEYEGYFFGFETDTEKGILADKRRLEGLLGHVDGTPPGSHHRPGRGAAHGAGPT
jgi:sugar phosphate isomerase/epimerase